MKRSLTLGQAPFHFECGCSLEILSTEILDVGHTLQGHYRSLHCHILHRSLKADLLGLGGLSLALLDVVDNEYDGTRLSLHGG